MTQEGQLPPPPVMWAQRQNILFVTICLEDCKDPTIKIDPEVIYFKGIGGTEQKMHEVNINLYSEIVPSKTIQNLQGRTFELILTKKKAGPYWPRLTKEKTKAHWLRSDFNKWKDEYDSDKDEADSASGAAVRGPDLEAMIRQMGGLGGSGDSKPNFDSFDDLENSEVMDSDDSDDNDLPDLMD